MKFLNPSTDRLMKIQKNVFYSRAVKIYIAYFQPIGYSEKGFGRLCDDLHSDIGIYKNSFHGLSIQFISTRFGEVTERQRRERKRKQRERYIYRIQKEITRDKNKVRHIKRRT